MTGAYQAAAQAIGLKVMLKSVSAQNYINFFTDPKARAGIDGFPAVDYGDYADPAALLAHGCPAGRDRRTTTSFSNPTDHRRAGAGAQHRQPRPSGQR